MVPPVAPLEELRPPVLGTLVVVPSDLAPAVDAVPPLLVLPPELPLAPPVTRIVERDSVELLEQPVAHRPNQAAPSAATGSQASLRRTFAMERKSDGMRQLMTC